MRKYYSIFIVFCVTLYADAQSVYGTVTDAQSHETLIFVNVIGPNKTGTTTIDDGSYKLQLENGEYEIRFSYIGYQTETFTIKIKDNQDYRLDVELTQQSSTLETVVLSAGKFEQKIEETTVSLDVIKPNIVQEKNGVKLEDIFQQSPGVTVINKQANIRSGSGWSMGAGSRVLMMVDDMPMMSPDAGQIQWKLLPNEAIYQMEVIKGASSALYGTSALNGLINVRTVIPTTTPRTEVSLFGGFYDSPSRKAIKWWDSPQMIGGATFLHARKINKTDLVFSGNWLNDQGYKYQEIDKRARFNLKLQFYPVKVKGLTWGFNSSMLYSKSGDAMLWQDYENNAYIARDSAITLSEGFDYYIDPFIMYKKGRSKHSLRSRIQGINNNARSSQANYENYSDYYYTEYQFQHFFDNQLTITAGGVAAFAFTDSEVFQGKHETKNYAIYTQLDKKWNHITASIGLRYEDYTVDELNFNKPVIRAGLNYRVARATYLRASYGGGYRYPSMAELFTKTNIGALYVFPNTQLQAESGWSTEVGVKQGFKIGDNWKGMFDLSAFINHFENMTEFTFAAWGTSGNLFNDLGFKSINVGPTQISGIEATVSSLGKIGEVDLRILTGYAYMQPVALDPNGVYATTPNNVELSYATSSSDASNNILKYRYQHLFKFDVQTEWKRMGLGFSARYNDFMQNIDKTFESGVISWAIPGVKASRDAHPNGDLVFDMRVYYNFNQSWQFSVIIDNLTNQEYSPRPANLGPPRKFTFKVLYRVM